MSPVGDAQKRRSMETRSWRKVLAIAFVASLLPCATFAQDINPPEEQIEAPKKEYSPFVGDHFFLTQSFAEE